MDFGGFHYISLDFNGFRLPPACLPPAFRLPSACLPPAFRLPMDFNGFLCISIDFNGFQWIYTHGLYVRAKIGQIFIKFEGIPSNIEGIP